MMVSKEVGVNVRRFSGVFLFWALAVLFLVYSVFGVLTQVAVIQPTTDRNVTGTIVLNASTFPDSLLGVPNNTVNVTYIWINSTGAIVNITTVSNFSVSQTIFNISFDTRALRDGLHNVTVNATNATNFIATNATFGVRITVDNTAPHVSILSPVHLANLSGSSLLINLTANDTTTKVGSVVLNITNNSARAEFIASINLSLSGTYAVGLYNGTLNTTALPDGNYTFVVFANDSVGIANTTMKINVTIDNTLPNITSLTAAVSGGTVNISWTLANDLANATVALGRSQSISERSNSNIGLISTHTFVFDNLPEGFHYFNATSCDAFRNCRTSELNFTARGGPPSGGGGGRGNSVYSKQVDIELSRTAAVVEYSLKSVGAEVEFSTLPRGLGVHKAKLDSWSVAKKQATITVSSTPQTVTLNVSELRKFDLNADGYYDLSVKLVSLDNSAVTLKFTVLDGKEAVGAAPVTGTTTTTTGGTSSSGSGTTTPPAGEGAAAAAAAEQPATAPAEEPAGVEEGGALSVGVIVGLVVVLLIIIGLIFFLATRKR